MINSIMKAQNILTIAAAVIFLASCKEEKEKPKVIYDNAAKEKPNTPKTDTTQIEIADLPILITGTDYLIHPIGDVRVYDGKSGYSRGNDEISYTISNYNEFEITGFLRNLKFQKTDSDSLQILSDKPVLIQSATYLAAFKKEQLLIYALADMDTNKDGRLDATDIKSLYISDIDGGNFTKLSVDFEELIDWKLLESKNRLYFRTIEDTNKNGEFDKEDVVHYNYVDLAAKEYAITQYSPI
jgi:hypothetical protein